MIINEILVEDPRTGDSIDLEFGDTLIETVIESVTQDGVVVRLDETAMAMILQARKKYIAESRQGVAEGLFGFGTKSKPVSPETHLVSLNRKNTFSDRSPSSEETQLYNYLENTYYENILAFALKKLSVGQIVSYYDMIYPKSRQAWKEYSNINDIIDKGRKEYATGLPRRAYDFLTLKKEAEEKERRWRGYEDRLETCKNELKRRQQYNQQGVAEDELDEAKYQGREVPLGKPMAGDVKKSKVYVKGPKGNVVKVNFGQKGVKIKKGNPGRRKNFRARHNCDNPGPRWKARYWSCRAW